MPRLTRGQHPSRENAAVVIGLDCATGLQSARILARHGIPVIGVARDPRHPCTRTRAVQRVVAADTAGSELIDALVRVGTRLRAPAVLFPCTDAAVLQVSLQRAALAPHFRIRLPAHRVVERLTDKVEFEQLAAELRLPTPRTARVADASGLDRAAAAMDFPCILKPGLKTSSWDAHSPVKVHRAETPQQLRALYARYGRYATEFIVQQWIDGADTALHTCNCYFDRRSEPVVTFVTRKLRQWPPSAGTGCLGEEVRDDAVRDLAIELFRRSGFVGLAYLEVKRDARTGELYMIEANVGRPTGRSATAEAAGVELLFAMYCDALDLPLPAGLQQRYEGVKWIDLRKDVRAAYHQWRRGELTLGGWQESVRGRKAHAVFSLSDPVPFIADCLGAARRGVRQRQAPLTARAGKTTPPPVALSHAEDVQCQP